VVGGSESVNVRFPATAILPIPEMEKFEVSGQFKPDAQIILPRNTTCTKWLDLTDLVLSNDLDIAGPDGADLHEEFVEAVTGAQQTLETVGLSCRWMIAARNDNEMELQLQALPTRGTVLNKTPALSKERTATTILAR
jgi:hypothetical protein